MAHLLSRSGLRDAHALTASLRSCRLLATRYRSSRSEKAAQLVEIDLSGEDSSSSGSEVEMLGMRRLEDAIHGIIVRRAAPDWLPFIPGSSYWVPPRGKAFGLVELVGRLANPMTEEEILSFTSARGWPSLTFFVEGVSPHAVKISRKMVAVQSDDEEG